MENNNDRELRQTFGHPVGSIEYKSKKCFNCIAITLFVLSLGTAFLGGYYLKNICREEDGSGW